MKRLASFLGDAMISLFEAEHPELANDPKNEPLDKKSLTSWINRFSSTTIERRKVLGKVS
jgi:hypothetical protein